MPMKSKAMRGAMYAAAAGKSTLGIPKSVGKKMVAHDPGGILPSHASRRDYAKGGSVLDIDDQPAPISNPMGDFSSPVDVAKVRKELAGKPIPEEMERNAPGPQPDYNGTGPAIPPEN